MKKVFFVIALIAVSILTSCKCSCDKQVAELNVENLISTDKEQMFLEFGEDCRWYETCVVLSDFLDADTTLTIAGVSNIFQALIEKDESYDTFVISFAHTPDANGIETKHGFWVEDFPLNNEQITITFAQALERVFEVNYPKPHSKYVVLRKEVGPNAANPQYIFGNSKAQLYVDAVTGNVTDVNPVFGTKLGTPLGEWP